MAEKASPKKVEKSSKSEKVTGSGIIKTPGAKVSKKEEAPATRRGGTKSESKDGSGKDATSTKDGQKGILKKKKGSSRSKDKKKDVSKVKSTKKVKKTKKTLYEKIAAYFGFYVGTVQLIDPMAVEAVDALDLQPWHLRRLRARFDLIDIDGSGNIDYEEFFEAVEENRSPFTDKLFALIDLDGSGTIEFDEYVRVMATYCMFTKDEIMRFCFECFDVDKSGTIDEKEFMELCKCVNNAAPSFPANFKKALEEFDVNEDGLIDYGEFLQIDQRYPLVLFPAFRLQDTMQKNSLGSNVWKQVMESYEENKRIEEYKATHGGKAPPEPLMKQLGKTFLPCLYKEKVHIKVGKEMEDRHRAEVGKA